MGFFSKLKAAVGIGGAKVALSFDGDRFSAGSTISGTVTLTGGGLEQPIETLHLELLEEWQTPPQKEADGSSVNIHTQTVTKTVNGEQVTVQTTVSTSSDDEAVELDEDGFEVEVESKMESHFRTVADLVLAEALTVDEGFEQAFPFTVTLPADAQPSGEFRTWELYAWAGIPKAIDPTDRKEIQVG